MKRSGLSDRQLDVLELALEGLTNQQIGDRLFLSIDTVKTHFRRTYAELRDADGRAAAGALHAVAIALRQGLLEFDEQTRRISRPPERKPLPAYVDLDSDRGDGGVPAGRSLQQRRADLGW